MFTSPTLLFVAASFCRRHVLGRKAGRHSREAQQGGTAGRHSREAQQGGTTHSFGRLGNLFDFIFQGPRLKMGATAPVKRLLQTTSSPDSVSPLSRSAPFIVARISESCPPPSRSAFDCCFEPKCQSNRHRKPLITRITLIKKTASHTFRFPFSRQLPPSFFYPWDRCYPWSFPAALHVACPAGRHQLEERWSSV